MSVYGGGAPWKLFSRWKGNKIEKTAKKIYRRNIFTSLRENCVEYARGYLAWLWHETQRLEADSAIERKDINVRVRGMAFDVRELRGAAAVIKWEPKTRFAHAHQDMRDQRRRWEKRSRNYESGHEWMNEERPKGTDSTSREQAFSFPRRTFVFVWHVTVVGNLPRLSVFRCTTRVCTY